MSGYYGISMSNNAVKAYEEGKKPYSKWTKKGIVDRINEKFSNGKLANIPNKRPEIFSNFIEAVKKTPLVELKRILLIDTEYHHTSIYYNSTIFYDVFPYGCNVQYMKQITSKLKKATEDYKQRPKVEKPPIDETKYHAFANTTSSSKMVANASRERIKPKAILLATGFIQIKFMVQKKEY